MFRHHTCQPYDDRSATCFRIPSRFSQRWTVVTSRFRYAAISFHESKRSSGRSSGGFLDDGVTEDGALIALSWLVRNCRRDCNSVSRCHGKRRYSTANRGKTGLPPLTAFRALANVSDGVSVSGSGNTRDDKEDDMTRRLMCLVLCCAAIIVSKAVQTESWHALVGAESPDHASQVIAFLPNEMSVRAGDSFTWSFPVLEPHSATFLTPGLVRPAFTVGCPVTNTTPDPSAFDNTSCVNSGRITTVGSTYTVTFPKPGKLRLVCLVHVNMTGTIHVLDALAASASRSGVLRRRGREASPRPVDGWRRGTPHSEGRCARRVGRRKSALPTTTW